MTTMRLGQRDDEPTPPNTFPDFDWVNDNEKELIEKYGEGFVIVFEKQVLGFGSTLDEAIANAEANLPPDRGDIIPIVDTIHRRSPFGPVIRSRYLTVTLPEKGDEE
jgi:hypothetical protein